MIILNSKEGIYTVTHILRKWIHQTGWKREAALPLLLLSFLSNQVERAVFSLFSLFFSLSLEGDLVPKRKREEEEKEEGDYLNKSPL